MKNCIKLWCASVSLISLPVWAEESYSPAANHDYPQNVYFGDTHLHTNLSVDANGMGNISLGPDDAYRFAKGEGVKAHNGMTAKLSRPLDFLVVSDHAANMGVMRGARSGEKRLLKLGVGQKWHEQVSATKDIAKDGFFWKTWHQNRVRDKEFLSYIWHEVTEAADNHNDPNKFTAFIGYEWSSWQPQDYAAIHRVVIFKDSAQKANQIIPFSSIDSLDPEKLWAFMAGYEEKTGGNVLAITHNSNLAYGQMFALEDYAGNPLSKGYAELRSRWEPLVEATQLKGDSETHPYLSPDDEFADYETWNSWRGRDVGMPLTEKQKKDLPHDYVRSVLKLGLQEQARLGTNPFKVGMIGSTDAHTSFATADENNFWGKMVLDNPSAERINTQALPWAPKGKNWEYAASGYAAVWAKENTRESLFSAMKRRETYATTGPRMTVRFFGGWDYEKDDALRPGLADIGYAKGVPMGGDLTAAPNGKTPSFLIRAVKDPDGANLDRIQVVKGWRSTDGKLHEKVYNVALSDDRKDKGKRTRPVGNTVNVKDATYTNSIGDSELSTTWTDPDFNADELAFYYVRVLEIPTPRWAAYDIKRFNIKELPDNTEVITQERAYTSPIWYTP